MKIYHLTSSQRDTGTVRDDHMKIHETRRRDNETGETLGRRSHSASLPSLFLYNTLSLSVFLSLSRALSALALPYLVCSTFT